MSEMYVSNEIFTTDGETLLQANIRVLPVRPNATKEEDRGLEKAKLTDGNL